MRYVSTRRQAPEVSLGRALTDGLASDGGLYMPDAIPEWPAAELRAMASAPLGVLAARVLTPFVGDEISHERLLTIATAALDFPIPLVEVEPGVHALELFHGPTLAFKDVAARMMARLFTTLADRPLTVLVATSGDTGGAVAHAFAGIAGTRVLVLYPCGRVSPTQEAQLTTFNGEGRNVTAYAVGGSFDDCQRLVKEALADPDLRREAGLTSANSINVGRLLPQMIYYVHAVLQLAAEPESRATRDDLVAPEFSPAVIAVPSGNLGNLTAGVMAKRAGAPVGRFIAATNINDVVPEYLRTGRFDPRPSVSTIANAMDVGNPSNFERLLWLYGSSEAAMRAEIAGSAHTEEQVREVIRRVFEERGYLLDPHSAIGYLALQARAPRDGRPGIFLATAHPAKFREIVEPIVGRAIDIPPALSDALARRHPVLEMEPTLHDLRERIVGH